MGGGSLFGLIMLIGSIVLYALGRVKPEIRRDSDIVYVIVGLIYGITTIASANMAVVPPGIVEFQNLLAIGCIVSLMWQNISDRQNNNFQPSSNRGEGAFDSLRQRFAGDSRRRPEPARNSGRPDNGVYRYEASLDNYDRFNEPRPDQRRIRGSEPSSGRGGYGDSGYGDPGYGDPNRRPPLNDSGRPRDYGREPSREPGREPGRDSGFAESGRGGRDGFDSRGAGSDRRPRPNNDWEEDNYVDGRRSPAGPQDGFGPDRNTGRDSGRNNGRNASRNAGRDSRRSQGSMPRDERSMEGRPLSRPLEDDARPVGGPMDRPGPGRSAEGASLNSSATARPVMDRPPLDMPPRRRPRSPGPDERAGANRPVIDAMPTSGGRPLTPPPAAPMQPLDVAAKDDYVDFKPVAPPPESERDNSDQFDD